MVQAGHCGSHRNSVDPISFLRVLALYCLVFFLHVWITSRDPRLPLSNASLVFLLKTPAWGGVWILFTVSGYLIGKGFYSGKYTLDWGGLKKFYLSRLIRIAPQYLLLCLVVGLLVHPAFFVNSPADLLRILTFTYNGAGGVVGIGATWYVSTIMQLYLAAPLLFLLFRGLSRNKHANLGAIFVVAAGGLVLRYLMHELQVPWFESVYTPAAMNLDLFTCGMLLNGATLNRRESAISKDSIRVAKVLSASTLLGLIAVNCYVYFYEAKPYCLPIYQYVLPTAYLFAVAFYLHSYDYQHTAANERLSLAAARRNPLRMIDWLSTVSYEFYLWHSTVIAAVLPLTPLVDSPVVTRLAELTIAGIASVVTAWVMYSMTVIPIRSWRSGLAGRNVVEAGEASV